MGNRKVNLLKETVKVLNDNNKSLSDILFCQVGGEESTIYTEVSPNNFTFQSKSWFTLEDFIKVAEKTDYDNGFGIVEIDLSLKLVGKDFWLERVEYDGSEGWEFKTIPVKREVKIELDQIKLKDN